MDKNKLIVAILFISATALAARAPRNYENVQGTQSTRAEAKTQEPAAAVMAEVNLETAQHTYQESKMSISGPMTGISGQGLFNVSHGIFLGGRLEYMTGDTTYDGEYIDINNTGVRRPVSAKSKDNFTDIGALGAIPILRESRNLVYAFSGLAYRYHNNKVQNSGGYTREISALYWPAGINASLGISEQWKLRAEIEVDRLLSGQTKSYLSEVRAGDTDVVHSQSTGFGFKAYVRAQYQFSNMSLQLGPYYSYWKVDDSNVVPATLGGKNTYVIEPENTTTRLGMTLGLLF